MALTITCFMAYTNSAREGRELPNRLISLALTETALDKANGGHNNNGTLGDCLNAIREIKSCANEIVEYFKDGATDIGTPCCQPINIITLHCWPAMLTAVRFTSDEYSVFVGYWDASAVPAPIPSAPSVVPPPKANKSVV